MHSAQALTILLRLRLEETGLGGRSTVNGSGEGRRILARLGAGVGFLVFMNVAGMYLNLWGNVPDYSTPGEAFASIPLLGAHVAIAIAILANISITVISTFRPQNRHLRPVVALAVGFAALAVFSGVEFTFYGGDDLFSMTMEIGFAGLISVTAYMLFVVTRQLKTSAQ